MYITLWQLRLRLANPRNLANRFRDGKIVEHPPDCYCSTCLEWRYLNALIEWEGLEDDAG